MAVETRDISLAGRILASFPEHLDRGAAGPRRTSPSWASWPRSPRPTSSSCPNISASMPQLKAPIAELQAKGYALPDYPDEPRDDAERDVQARYDKVKGSAVNPVLREGNSDRRAPARSRQYARKHPHSMGAWSPDSKTHVATWASDDFRSQRAVRHDRRGRRRCASSTSAADGTTTVLKDAVAGARRRDRRRHRSCAGARSRVPRRADRRRQGARACCSRSTSRPR